MTDTECEVSWKSLKIRATVHAGGVPKLSELTLRHADLRWEQMQESRTELFRLLAAVSKTRFKLEFRRNCRSLSRCGSEVSSLR